MKCPNCNRSIDCNIDTTLKGAGEQAPKDITPKMEKETKGLIVKDRSEEIRKIRVKICMVNGHIFKNIFIMLVLVGMGIYLYILLRKGVVYRGQIDECKFVLFYGFTAILYGIYKVAYLVTYKNELREKKKEYEEESTGEAHARKMQVRNCGSE